MSRAEHAGLTPESAGRFAVPARRRLLTGVAGLGFAALLAGCGAGQITQTSSQAPAINGASGQAGAIALRDVELAYPDNCQGTYQPGASAPLVVSIVNTGNTPDTLTSVSTPAALDVTIDGSATGTRAIPGSFLLESGTDVDDHGSSVVSGGTATTPEATSTAPATTGSTTTGSATTGSTTTGAAATSTSKGSPAGTGTFTPGSTTATGPAGRASGTALAPGKVSIVLTGIKSINGQPLRAGLTIPVTFYFARSGAVTVDVPIAAMPDSLYTSCRASAKLNP